MRLCVCVCVCVNLSSRQIFMRIYYYCCREAVVCVVLFFTMHWWHTAVYASTSTNDRAWICFFLKQVHRKQYVKRGIRRPKANEWAWPKATNAEHRLCLYSLSMTKLCGFFYVFPWSCEFFFSSVGQILMNDYRWLVVRVVNQTTPKTSAQLFAHEFIYYFLSSENWANPKQSVQIWSK